ncbi:VOC family protein [Shewanella violacea]|uniref:VOC domain-containing protein n=1 Tax=Shewanella violacea (strain JCM 10179 / CIP 106290 / LMG 19151 / DSS12) TaxID=637905 RepID=D4ZJU0_SHEVD|nr:hypothetical protein [Shewanella violacea]BAJ01939.1 hypothetical protein SVI_1968 [Shewanella violacea DSS12]
MNFNWQELHTPSFTASVAFYAETFGCTIREVPGRNGKRYGLIIPKDSAKPVAGIFETGSDEEMSGWLGYVTVEKLSTTVERALANGAVEMMSFEIPYIGLVSVLKDSAGQEINLIEYTPRV